MDPYSTIREVRGGGKEIALFTTVPLIGLFDRRELDIYVAVFLNCLFLLAYFLLIRNNGEIIRIKQVASQKNNIIFYIFDQTKGNVVNIF